MISYKKKNKKGFTLTELIVVIVIIGILAAVLIPSITSYIKKAKISNDVQDAANMNLLLQTTAIEEGVELSQLDASEVRHLVNSVDKNYTFVPRYNKGIFLFNLKTKRIEYFSEGLPSERHNSADSIHCVDEIIPGYLYLNTTGDLALKLQQLKRVSSEAEYTALAGPQATTTSLKLAGSAINVEDPFGQPLDISTIINKYNPKHTLFINSTKGFTTAFGSAEKVKYVVFEDDMAVITNLNLNGVYFEENAKITLPLSVRLVEQSAFLGVKTATVVTTKTASQKIQYVENALSPSMIEANSNIVNNYVSYEDLTTRVAENSKLISFTVDGTIQSRKSSDGSVKDDASSPYQKTFKIIEEEGKYLVAIYNNLDGSGQPVEKIELSNKKTITVFVGKCSDKYQEQVFISNPTIKLNTQEFFSQNPNVDVFDVDYSVTYPSDFDKPENADVRMNQMQIKVFDDKGMALNFVIVYAYKFK